MSAYTYTLNKYDNGIPGQVKVGPVTYRVIVKADPKGKQGDEEVSVFGLVDFKKSEILINEELNPMMQWQCLWHEIVHVIFEQLGLDNDCEGQVDALAYKLLEIVIDNGFVKFPAPETYLSSSDAYLAHGE